MYAPSTFFEEQLTAFEVWLTQGSELRSPPEQLPIVLQVKQRGPYLYCFFLSFVLNSNSSESCCYRFCSFKLKQFRIMLIQVLFFEAQIVQNHVVTGFVV